MIISKAIRIMPIASQVIDEKAILFNLHSVIISNYNFWCKK
jgi:hypothetical protein